MLLNPNFKYWKKEKESFTLIFITDLSKEKSFIFNPSFLEIFVAISRSSSWPGQPTIECIDISLGLIPELSKIERVNLVSNPAERSKAILFVFFF